MHTKTFFVCVPKWIKTTYVIQIQKYILYSTAKETQLKNLLVIFLELNKSQRFIHSSF